jgi:hypothetical protein
MTHPSATPRQIDARVPNVARVWNYLIGGKDNFKADRMAADQLVAAAPVMGVVAPASRAFLRRAVRYLVRDAGIRQFLDIGTGIPTASNTHEVAQSLEPECRIVYVDNDPVVLSHARALLTSAPEGVTSYIDADAREPDKILAAAGATLDFDAPVAIVMVDILNFIDDTAEATSIVSRLMAAVSPGSYVVLMQPADDLDPTLVVAAQLWNEVAAVPVTLRSRDEVAGFVASLELVEPGLVTVPEWRPDGDDPAYEAVLPLYAAVARRPTRPGETPQKIRGG